MVRGEINDAPSGLRDDFSTLEIVHTDELPWTPSPSPGVDRKRLELSGPVEAGRVTSIVRYEPGSRFPAHPHPGGEEILVLSGVFSDHTGDHGAGVFLLNPEGYNHAPYSDAGCVLFVKLRQSPGLRQQVRIDTSAAPFETHPSAKGVSTLPLYQQDSFPEQIHIVRVLPEAKPRRIEFPDGSEVFVLDGTFENEYGRCRPGSWVRFPSGSGHTLSTETGCLLYQKTGHLFDI